MILEEGSVNIFRSKMIPICAAALALGIVFAASVTQVGVARAAELVSEVRDLPPFNRIDARGNYELQVTAGEVQSVTIETVERDLKRVKTEVRGETLVISFKDRWFSFLFDNERIVRISLPDLRGIELSGAGEIDVTGVDSETLDLTVSGAADVSLAGTCGKLSFDLNGAADVSARELQCETVEAIINGVGSAELYASNSVSAVINGLGEITVYGNPQEVEKQINGLGDFEIAE